MKTSFGSLWVLLALFAAAAAAPGARGVIAVKLPVSQVFDGSRVVVVGTVTKVNPDTGGVEASAKALKGASPGDLLRFKLENLPAVTAALKPGAPFVLLTGRKAENFALHLGDTWLLPEPTDNPQLFAVRNEKDLRQSYPGTTAALVRIVESKAAGKYDMLDVVSEASLRAMLRGGVREYGRIDATGVTALFAAGGKTGSSVMCAARDHFMNFMVTGAGLEPHKAAVVGVPSADFATMGSPVPEKSFAALTRDGKFLTFAGAVTPDKTVPLWFGGPPASAAAFGNFGEDDRQHALVVRDNDVLRYPLDGQGQPADFVRMTGERVTSYHKDNPKWLAGATAAGLDANGDGRTDFLIHTAHGAMLLINRGHGAFFVDPDIDKALRTADGKSVIGDGDVWTCVDVNADGYDDVLIASKSGACRVVMNRKPIEEKK